MCKKKSEIASYAFVLSAVMFPISQRPWIETIDHLCIKILIKSNKIILEDRLWEHFTDIKE